MVVAACPTLCKVSASSAIEPEMATMTIWMIAVIAIPARPIQAARMPSSSPRQCRPTSQAIRGRGERSANVLVTANLFE